MSEPVLWVCEEASEEMVEQVRQFFDDLHTLASLTHLSPGMGAQG